VAASRCSFRPGPLGPTALPHASSTRRWTRDGVTRALTTPRCPPQHHHTSDCRRINADLRICH
jgi:hypothetical protein